MFIPQEVEKILFTEQEIKQRVKEMGAQLTEDYKGRNPLFLCVLKGAAPFFTDLIREMEIEVQIEFIRASSYIGTESTGDVRLSITEFPDIKGRDVVVVEDIVDTARTMSLLKKYLLDMSPASVKVASFLDKPSRRVVEDFRADYVGYSIEDHFVVGYGLDCDQRFRNLPYIGIFKT